MAEKASIRMFARSVYQRLFHSGIRLVEDIRDARPAHAIAFVKGLRNLAYRDLPITEGNRTKAIF